jgi:hypothetical protein
MDANLNTLGANTMKTKKITAGVYEAKCCGFTVLVSLLEYETTFWTYDIQTGDGDVIDTVCGTFDTKRDAMAAAEAHCHDLKDN